VAGATLDAENADVREVDARLHDEALAAKAAEEAAVELKE